MGLIEVFRNIDMDFDLAVVFFKGNNSMRLEKG